jgi:peptide deformylase
MAIRSILEYPDRRLALQSAPVQSFDERTGQIVDDLIETLHAHESIGLSAPQLDERLQILVMDHSGDRSDPREFINPVISERGRYGLAQERCLSVPGLSTLVFRATELRVRAFDRQGKLFETRLNGMPAVCLQHEMDHFQGKLLADRVNWLRRRRLLATLRRNGLKKPESLSGEAGALHP